MKKEGFFRQVGMETEETNSQKMNQQAIDQTVQLISESDFRIETRMKGTFKKKKEVNSLNHENMSEVNKIIEDQYDNVDEEEKAPENLFEEKQTYQEAVLGDNMNLMDDFIN